MANHPHLLIKKLTQCVCVPLYVCFARVDQDYLLWAVGHTTLPRPHTITAAQ